MISNGVLSFYLAVIEFALLAVLLKDRKKHNAIPIAGLIVFFLAGYQLSEAIMCRFGYPGQILPYIAITDISCLPPLVLVFTCRFWDNNSRVPYLLFIPVAFFAVYYGVNIDKMALTRCTPFYAMYHYPLGDLYGFFYYLPILLSMISFKNKIRDDKNREHQKLGQIFLASLAFTAIPVVIAFASKAAGNAELLKSVESVMCKSAVVLAAALTYIANRLSEDVSDLSVSPANQE